MWAYLLPAAALALYLTMRTPAGLPTAASAGLSKDAARGVTMKCQEKYCAPHYQIHVDKPVHTLLRDDSLQIGLTAENRVPRIDTQSLGQVYNSTKAQYFKEAHEHPGVRLVAHTVS